MEDLLRPIYQERASDPRTLGVLRVEKHLTSSPVTDNFDTILLIVVTEQASEWSVKHYEFESGTAALHSVTAEKLREWIEFSGYRRMFQWVSQGQILFDRNEYLYNLKEEVNMFPKEQRELKMAMEFAKGARSYKEAVELYDTSNLLDSYNKIIRSLHALARLTILEQGYHPELMVWEQVKRIDPAIHKLYQELITSDEQLNERIELMMLAIDFTLGNKVDVAIKHLQSVLKEKNEPWAFGELKQHPALAPYALDLGMMVHYLVDKNRLKVKRMKTKGEGVYHRLYQLTDQP
ncbi:nucleotidyltransferase-like protein [Streptohalobacillus salinus]|uniref:Nucleotidyltransferase-like protein n=1 Tax=Streptohalobacillus salinus TaxID=621096 RepID=A0A2V3W3T7_9BACI|nr:nucleotidyltransferase-like protein [Streptohalobacillus salinus]PXW88957.1 nucleotidyltransferase-like protein [Streptohalobacillus salinus]